MRINQFVAGATGLSRRAADAAIAEGRVTIGNHPAVLGDVVGDNPDICLDGKLLTLPIKYTYVMLHKPEGYVSSRIRQGKSPTLYDLVPPRYRDLNITGRLDLDSSGLMLLTNDGGFLFRHTHPSHAKQKVYELTLDRPLKPADRDKLEAGVELEDGPSHVKVVSTDGPSVTVSLSEGRNRQLRRTFGALGYGVERLHRTQLGSYQLGDLPEGKWRSVTAEDSR